MQQETAHAEQESIYIRQTIRISSRRSNAIIYQIPGCFMCRLSSGGYLSERRGEPLEFIIPSCRFYEL